MKLIIILKIIYIIFSFSLVLLSLSSILNHLLIVFAQCYPLLFLSFNNFFCCTLPFQSLSIFYVLTTFLIFLEDKKTDMLFVNNFNVIWDSIIATIRISHSYRLCFYSPFRVFFFSFPISSLSLAFMIALKETTFVVEWSLSL